MASRTVEEKLGMEEALDQLYAQPPDAFTRVRNALARKLSEQGAKKEAATLRAQTRPTLAAWALNQAVRREPDLLERLLASGRELRQAQRRVLSGVKAHGLNEAMRERREAMRLLGGVAARVLEEAGREPGAQRGAIDATLQAASVDGEAGQLLRLGRLTRPLPPPSGFGELAGLSVVRTSERAAPKGRRSQTGPSPAERRRLETARMRARQAAEHAANLTRRAAELRTKADEASDEAARLSREADRARKAADQLAREASTAEHEADRARRATERRTEALQRLEGQRH